jgi:glycosyltransferase involved in cell wall biosynthesis
MSAGVHQLRVAWLFPTIEHCRGPYWQPFLRECASVLPETRIFTRLLLGFIRGSERAFPVVAVARRDNSSSGERACPTSIASLSLLKRVVAWRPHFIFSFNLGVSSLLALIASRLSGARAVVIWDGYAPGIDVPDDSARGALRRFVARRADAFITNSRAGAAYLTMRLGVPEQRILARPYEVPDLPSLLFGGTSAAAMCVRAVQRPKFLYVGRIIPGKGWNHLLSAAGKLRAEGKRFSLIIAGDGGDLPALEAAIRDLRLEDTVRALGFVPYEKLGEVYRAADVFVFPTNEDVWGVALLEAMAFGLPAISSTAAGAAELVRPGENGFLFDAGDADQLAELMRRFIDEPGLARRLGAAAHKDMSLHTPQAAAAELAAFTRSLL